MNVLDLDLDFFLERIPVYLGPDRRPEAIHSPPWSEERVRTFLECQLGLDRSHPVRGAVVTEHDEVFWLWKRLKEDGELVLPFRVVHVDSHADLACGDSAYSLITTELIDRPVVDRETPDEGDRRIVRPGTYLLVAVACRWIEHLTYVHHVELKEANLDIPYPIRGPGLKSIILSREDQPDDDDESRIEVRVPLNVVSASRYHADEPFDFVFLATSPKYTPPATDELIAVVREYITETR